MNPASSLSSPASRRLGVLCLLAAAAVGAVLFLLSARPADTLGALRPFLEDAYYPLSVSRHLALGNGVTIDGEQLTNGFQPLFTFLSAGSFLLSDGDRIGGLRLQYVLHGMIFVATALLCAFLLRRVAGEERGVAALGVPLLAYAAAPYLISVHFNGLETGLVLALHVAVIAVYVLRPPESDRAIALFGALVGLLVLARIDAAFFAVILGLAELWLNRAVPRRALRRFVLFGGAAFLVSLPWWAYNVIAFGHLMPSSGSAQEDFGLTGPRAWNAVLSVTQVLLPWLYSSKLPAEGVWVWVRLALGPLSFAALVWCLVSPAFPRLVGIDPARPEWRRFRFMGVLLTVQFVVLLAYYPVFSFAFYFYARYFSPVAALAAMLGGLAAMALARRFPAAAGVAAAGLFAQAMVLGYVYMSGRYADGNIHYDSVVMAEKYVPRDAVLAGGQSGTLGFFRDRVVNLDGKVNSALGPFSDRIPYLNARGIRYFMDWPMMIPRYLAAEPHRHGWCLVAKHRRFLLYYKVDPEGGPVACPAPPR